MLDRTRAVLVVVDFQDKVMPRDAATVEQIVGNTIRFVEAARKMGLPILVTEQNPEKLGTTTERLARVIEDLPRISKMEFSCLGNADFRAALEKTGRRQLILTGVEAHVCILQTALEAIESGYEAFVVTDAVASLSPASAEAGFRRMAQNGVQLVTTQMALFELLRAAGTDLFRELRDLLK